MDKIFNLNKELLKLTDEFITGFKDDFKDINSDIKFIKDVIKRHRGDDVFFLGKKIISQLVARRENVVWKIKHYQSIGQRLKESLQNAENAGSRNFPQV